MPRRFRTKPGEIDPIGFLTRDKFIEYKLGHSFDKEKTREYIHIYNRAKSKGKVVTVFVPYIRDGKQKYHRVVVPTYDILSYLVQRGFIDSSVLKKKLIL